MSLPINIQDLIHQRKVEMTRIEYKSDWNPESIIHTITAFANDFDNMGGGYILIGVEEENGRPKLPLKGLEAKAIDEIQQDILNKCNLIEPRYIPVLEPYAIDGKEIIVLWAPGGEERPYRCPEEIYSKRGGAKSIKSYYIRKGSRTLKANGREEQELISMARDIPFDDRINFHASISDLRPTLLADYLGSVKSDLSEKTLFRSVEDTARDMQLLRGPSEYLKPVNVGLMFFSDKPERFFPCARIEVVDKPDPTGLDMTEKVFSGPLDRQLKDALAYIRNYIIKEYVTKTPDSELAIRAYNWPYQAVEEALCNAVYHKSYQIHEPITVTITPKKLEILSLPGPDRSISDQMMEKKTFISRRYRNRRIGDYLKELEIVEGRNTGIPLILSSMKQNGSPEPEFETDEDRSYFLTVLPVHHLFLKKESKEEKKTQTRRSRDELKTQVREILSRDGYISTNELAFELDYTKLTDTLRSVVYEMMDSGEVEYLYPDKKKSRNQKLRLVTKK